MNPQLVNSLVQILNILLPILIPVVIALIGYFSVVAGAWLHARTRQLKSMVSASDWQLITSYAQDAVKSAEQLSLIGTIAKEGAAKKAYVIAAIQQWVDKQGLTVSATDLDTLIESSIKDGVQKGYDYGTISLPVASPVKADPIIATTVPSGVPIESSTPSA